MALNILRRWKQRRLTVNAWAQEYRDIVVSWHLTPKTLANRINCLRHTTDHIGNQRLVDIRPADIARMVTDIWASGRHFTARRVLYEAESLFEQAILAGIIDRNPATPVKSPPAPVARSRLTFENWQTIQQWTAEHSQPWFAYALRLALVTGQRRADLVAMHHHHVQGDHLRIHQQKSGARVALPLDLHLDALKIDLRGIIQESNDYRHPGSYLLRKGNGAPLGAASLSAKFAEARDSALAQHDWGERSPPTFHEIRSLSERLYRGQGIDTKTLLGHKRQSMTDQYNDDRGLSADDWTHLTL